MRKKLKYILGQVPFAVEAYWYLRQNGKPTGGFSFQKLRQAIPQWREEGLVYRRPQKGKRILLFATLRYWLEHAVLLGMSLGALGHEVYLAYLPYANWQKPISVFDLRRQNMFVRFVLSQAQPLLKVVPLLSLAAKPNLLPDSLREELEALSLQDTQYTQQVEDIPRNGKLYHLRMERNSQAALAAINWMKKFQPDEVILPSGSILEFGAIYHAARYLDIPAVSYEFGEQRQRIWFSLNSPVMHQDTDELWQVYSEKPLTYEQLERIQNLFSSRQKASLWENFARQWQGVTGEGGQQMKASLHLDERPVVLLAANVIGDSLTLGRQVFTKSMTEWLTHTAQDFAQRKDIQFLVRIHPGERYTTGPSVAEIFKQSLSECSHSAFECEHSHSAFECERSEVQSFPEHIHLIDADAPVNTYDLIQIANLGLVYTTTVGLEMALSGVPTIVVGNSHYRSRGFTLDPSSWEEYQQQLADVLNNPNRFRLSHNQVELAWRYAYHFFFDYPMPFPWHLWHFWLDVKEWSLARVLSDEGQALFGETFRCLTGEARHWQEAE